MGHAGGLVLIKKLVANKDYTYSDKVEEFLRDGFFTFEDIECCILGGYVYKTMKDKHKNSIGNKVYVIKGKDLCGYDFYTQGKIVKDKAGRIYFFITAHR